MVELRHVDIERDFAEHLDESAIAVVGETRVAALFRQTGGGDVVQPKVEDGVHHAGHGELRAGADAEQQRVVGVAELLADLLLELHDGLVDFLLNLVGNFVAVIEVDVADVGGNGEARRDGKAGARHLGQPGAFAAEHIFHGSVAVGCSAAERINVFLHLLSIFASAACLWRS